MHISTRRILICCIVCIAFTGMFASACTPVTRVHQSSQGYTDEKAYKYKKVKEKKHKSRKKRKKNLPLPSLP